MRNDWDCDTASFQGKHSDEVLQFYTRQHWVRLVGPLLRLLAWNVCLLAFWYIALFVMNATDPMAISAVTGLVSLFFIIAHLDFLDRIYKYFLYVIIVTDKKIHRIKKSLICMNDHQSIDLWMLQDIHKCQHGIIQNALGYGSLTLEAQETVLRLHYLPHIGEKYKSLMHLREQARGKMAYLGGDLSNEKEGEEALPILKFEPAIS